MIIKATQKLKKLKTEIFIIFKEIHLRCIKNGKNIKQQIKYKHDNNLCV